jgi:uncharacterized protein YjbJ (UPF0337 family)
MDMLHHALVRIVRAGSFTGYTSDMEHTMNKDTIAGNWKQLRGKVQQRWGKLTNDDLDVIAGKKDELVGKIQEHYGEAKEDVERDVDAMWDSADDELSA